MKIITVGKMSGIARSVLMLFSGRCSTTGLLLAIAFVAATAARLDAAGLPYKLEVEHGTYHRLEGAVPLAATTAWDWDIRDDVEPYAYLDLGTTVFNFMGTEYTFTPGNKLGVSVSGNLKIMAEQTAVIIDPFFTALDSVASGAQVLYKIEGTPGSYIVKIEWRNVGFDGCPESNYTNFQIWLYQKTGVFEMYYGETVTACDSAYWGNTGPLIGIFQGSPVFDKIYDVFWLGGDPAQPAIVRNNFPPMNSAPASGTVYRFTPAVPVTSVADGRGNDYGLHIAPNPLSDSSTLSFTLDRPEQVRVSVSDLQGRLIDTVVGRLMNAGEHVVQLGGRGLAAGSYLVTVTIGETSLTKTIVVE